MSVFSWFNYSITINQYNFLSCCGFYLPYPLSPLVMLTKCSLCKKGPKASMINPTVSSQYQCLRIWSEMLWYLIFLSISSSPSCMCFQLFCCKMSHNINTKHPPLPVISMSFCCWVTLLTFSHNGGSALAAVRSAQNTSPGHGGVDDGGSLLS